MANNCGTLLAAGLGACNSRIQNIIGMLVFTKGTTYTSAQLNTIAQTKTYLSASAGISAIYLPLSDFEVTTDEPNIVTSSSGKKGIFEYQIPSAMAYLDRSFHDYKHLWDSDNTIVDVVLITKDNYWIMTGSSSGSYKGMRCTMNTQPNLPKTTDPLKAHQIWLFFDDVTEFQNMFVMSMPFSRTEVSDLVPVGLDMHTTSAYTAGSVDVQVNLRATGLGKAGLTDWAVVSSYTSDNTITDTDNGSGGYSLAIDKDHSGTPTNLAAGEWIKVQGKIIATSYVTYLTNVLTITP